MFYVPGLDKHTSCKDIKEKRKKKKKRLFSAQNSWEWNSSRIEGQKCLKHSVNISEGVKLGKETQKWSLVYPEKIKKEDKQYVPKSSMFKKYEWNKSNI